jgi:nicotinate-nucleotide adenylyltransferase
MKDSNNIGIFGGLFDPPHIGHLIIAHWVLQEFSLNKIIFIPSGNPPHKHTFSPYAVRHHMVKLAVQKNNRFVIDDIERRMTGKTYTIDVIRQLRRKFSENIYLIIGGDQWEEIHTWHIPDALINECQVIVVPRPGHKAIIKKALQRRVHMSSSPMLDISSTMIRNRTAAGASITYLVPFSVEKYIKQKKLYR